MTVGSPGPRRVVDAREHHGVYTQSRASYFPQLRESLTAREGREQRARCVDTDSLTARRPPSSLSSSRKGSVTSRGRLQSTESVGLSSVTSKLDRDGIAAVFDAFQAMQTLDEEEFVSEMLIGLKAHDASDNKRVEITGQLSDLFRQADIHGKGILTWEDFSFFIAQTTDVASALEDTVINKYQADTVPPSLNLVTEVEGMFYLPDVDQIVIQGTKSRGIQVLDGGTNRLRSQALDTGSSTAAIVDAVYTPRGRYIITASTSPVLSFYDIDHLRIRQQIPTPSFQTSLALQPSSVSASPLLYSAGVDGQVHAWDLESLSCRHTFLDKVTHATTVVDLELIPPTAQLACASMDGNIYMVDLMVGRVTRTLSGHTKGVAMLQYCAENKYLVSGGIDHKLQVWNPHLEHKIGSLPGHRSQLIGFHARPDIPELITADESGIVKIWDLRKFAAVQTIVKEMYVKGHRNTARGMTAMCYLESRQRIAIAHSTVFFMDPRRANQTADSSQSEDSTAHAEPEHEKSNIEEEAKPLSVGYHALSQSFLAITPWNIIGWDARTGRRVRSTPMTLGAQVTCVAMLDHRESSCFVGCDNGSIARLMLPTGSLIVCKRVHLNGDVRSIRVVQDERLVVSSGDDGNVILTSWETLEPIHSFNHWRGVQSCGAVHAAGLDDVYSVPLSLRSFFIGNEIDRLKAAFAVGDTNHSGKISLSLLPYVLEYIFPTSESTSLARITTNDSSQTLTFASFVAIVKDALANSTRGNSSGHRLHPLASVSSFDFHAKRKNLITASTSDDKYCLWDVRNSAVVGEGTAAALQPLPKQKKSIAIVAFLSPLPLFVCVEEHSPQLSIWTTTALPPTSSTKPQQCLVRYAHTHVHYADPTRPNSALRSRASTTFLTDAVRTQDTKAHAPTPPETQVNIQSITWFYSQQSAKRLLCVGDESGGVSILDLTLLFRRVDDLHKPSTCDLNRAPSTPLTEHGARQEKSHQDVFCSSILQKLHRWIAYPQHGVGVRALSATEVDNLLQPNANKHEIVISIGDNGAVHLWASDGQLLGQLPLTDSFVHGPKWQLRLDEEEIQHRAQQSATTILRQVEKRRSTVATTSESNGRVASLRAFIRPLQTPRVSSAEDALVALRVARSPTLAKQTHLSSQRSIPFSSTATCANQREEC